jgi:hypothetical protein
VEASGSDIGIGMDSSAAAGPSPRRPANSASFYRSASSNRRRPSSVSHMWRRPWLTFSARHCSTSNCCGPGLRLGLQMIGHAVAKDVLQGRGMLASKLALLTKGAQQADDHLALVD